MDLHIPRGNVTSLASTVGFITDGLDAVVVGQQISKTHDGCYHLVLAGNPRDLALACERAEKVGGVVD